MTSPAATSNCPGCGLAAPDTGEQPPTELVASAACHQLFGELLARDYSDPGYRRVHQLVVDSYVAQHAGGRTRREVRATGLCLMTLCLVCDAGADPADGPRLHQRMVDRRPQFSWLDPSRVASAAMTVADVLAARDADEHERLVRRWGCQVWTSWAAHHATIRAWNAYALSGPDAGDSAHQG